MGSERIETHGRNGRRRIRASRSNQQAGVGLKIGGGRPAADEEDQDYGQHDYQPGGDGGVVAQASATSGPAQIFLAQHAGRVNSCQPGDGGRFETGLPGRRRGYNGRLLGRGFDSRSDWDRVGHRKSEPDDVGGRPSIAVLAAIPAVAGDRPPAAHDYPGSAPLTVNALGTDGRGPAQATIGAI